MSEKIGFTNGPWSYLPGHYQVEDGCRVLVQRPVVVWPKGLVAVPEAAGVSSFEEMEANALLISQAPDLYEALTLMRAKYGKLHDFLSDAIEGCRLTEAEIPDDYEAIVEALCGCLDADVKAKEVLGKLGGGE